MSTDTLSREALLRAALLKKIQQQAHGAGPIVPASRPARVPLSLAQQRLWFLCELDPGASQASHISSALRLTGQLDRAAMDQAFAQLIARHESLRTHFAQEDGIPCQVVDEDLGGFALTCRDMRGDADADARLSAELAESMQQPFDLGRGPLLRVGLWRMRDDEHVLLITMHHIITDGWSLGVLVRELAGLYAAACEGRALALAPLPIQYADYAIWQRNEYSGEALDKQLAFWRSLLAGAPEGVELPTDHPRPAIQSHRGGSLPVALPEALTQDLRAFAARLGVTPYMVLLAAWALWLARRSGQDDIVVGSPVAGRTRREIEGLIGFFVNTLALRVRLAQELTVADLLAQVKETTLAAFAHQAVPFEQVVDAVRPARSLGRSPLFQTMVALNNTPDAGELGLPGLTLSPCATSHTTTHFELSLALSDGGGALSGAIEYASDLFDEDTVRTFAEEWQRLLAGMLANEAAEVWALPLMSAGESDRLWRLQNDTASPYAQDSLLHAHFEARVAERPDAEALVSGESRLSYRELDDRANRLAAHLQARGVAPAARVALCLPRGVEMVVAMLAVLKAGAVYVPLDPEYPRERLLHVLEDATPQLVLRRAADHTSLPDGNWEVLDWERLPWDAPATAPAPVSRNAESLCCLIFTSGSTGRPKGVMLRHRNLVNLASSNSPIAFAPGMRLAHAANIAFDAASWEIWGALCNGACLVVVSADELLDAERLSALLARERVDVLHLTVGLFHQHAEAMAPAFSRLSALLFGGEKADAQKVRRLLASGHMPRRLIQCYGPTETTTFASCEVIEALPSTAKTVPLGRPLANMRLYVLDGRGEPVPEGVVGEIYIAGAGVSAGYWQNDALTLERFMPDPRGETPDARMYRTGDLARRLADGRLEYMGRNDFQVKIRGYRIEPAEIEAALCTCEGVREAVVLAREDIPGDRRLVAYVRCEDMAMATAETFRASLASRLPEYMLPSAYVHMAEWPLTAHGKLDRSALPSPQEETRAARSYSAPEGETEQGLADIWQGLLGIERVGRDDHFFEIGGHSLLVVRLRSQVRDTFGVDLPLKSVFNRPRLRELAAELQDISRSDIGTIARADRSGHLPLSLAQQRLWFLASFDARASLAYHMPSALRLTGMLNRAAMKAALDRLIARQEGLRARFIEVEGMPYQAFAPEDAGFALAEHDLSHLPADQLERVVREQAEAEAAAPFDFVQGPLIRGRLLRLAEDEHVLLVTQHHIVSDAWSVAVMVREFAELYAAFCENRPDPLPPLDIQYADYAVWQRDWLQGEELERQIGFWRDHLVGAPALLELPLDRPRPLVQSHAGATTTFELPAELGHRLRALAHRHGVTSYMVVLAGWAALLSRLSGQQDVVVGTPVANRQRREVEGLLGFFVNTLALRVRLDGEANVADLLAQVKETVLAAFAHQELPFDQVVEAMQPVRSLSHGALVQTSFTWGVQSNEAPLELPGLVLSSMKSELDTTQFDLSLNMAETDDAWSGALVYASDLFHPETIERFIGCFTTLLDAMAADDAACVATLPILKEPERKRLLHDFNANSTEYPRDASIHGVFEQHAARRAEAIAVVCDGESISYGELNARANRLAHHLIAQGVRPDDRVAICIERSIDLIVGLLGILKAGGAYVPLDPSYPAERLAMLLEDSAPKVLITHSDIEAQLPLTDVPMLRLDVDFRVLQRVLPAHDPDLGDEAVRANHLAYVIYTSGSTGTPKGVMVEHRNVVRLVINNPYFQAGDDDCLVHAANPAFDAATWEIWGALLNGARLLVLPPADVLDARRLDAQLLAHGATAMWMTVGLFNQYAPSMQASLAKLRYLLVGGDALDPRTIRSLLAQAQRPAHLVNGYGPTETTTFACTHLIESLAEDAASVPIGRPIGNTRVYILDARGEPVPVGVAGEIHIGGDGVARGYLNQPGLTAERFVRDPFSADPQARMYRTGDLGRWLPDGTIEFLGRNDFQVKIRGFRIELGEIEAKLAACAGVREVAVLAREDDPGDKRLVAYVTAGAGAELSVADLRARLSAQLPDYMVPSAFVVLEAFPLTPNGKLDRKALPAPDGTSLTRREYEAPQGEIEQALAGIWQQLLGIERAGRNDHFFDLGGHSLLAVQLVSHVRERLGVEVPLRELFARPVLQAFAQAVQEAGASTLGRIARVGRERPLPLSLSQQRLWFIDQLDAAASRAYHMPAALRLSGRLNRDALKQALDTLVARQEGLRARLVAVDGVPHQVFAPEDTGFALQELDLGSLAPEAREQAIVAQAAEEADAPFDLSQGPLIRGRLLRVADEEHVLLITQHHIVSDGWSIGVIIREFAALYTAFCEGRADPLPPLEIQYADYAVWQRDWLQGEELERQTMFWREHLVGAPALLELPTDRPRPPVQRYAGSVVPMALSAELADKLRALAQAHGTTLFAVLLAGWSLLLSRLSGQDDVVVGAPVANRQRREVEDLVGFFVNTLALRVRVGEATSLADLLAQVRETTLAAFAHQELPFEQMVEAVQPARSLGHSPLFQAMLSLNNTPGGGDALALPGLTLSQVQGEHTIAQFDLSLTLNDGGAGLHGGIDYAVDLFDRATIERFAGHFATVLEAMAASDAQAVVALPIMTAVQKAQVLESFNATATDYPKDALIHQLFEAQVDAQPEALAVRDASASLSYAELDARANRLAHELIARGVGPDARVAICVERSLEMVVGLLGILKAGGAYVPLDPDYPPERLAFMLQDSAPSLLLTQSSLADALPAHAVATLCLDDAVAPWALRSTQRPDPQALGLDSRHLAYMIYTSGSTGLPKGVMNEHRGVVNRLLWAQREYQLNATDRVLQKTPFGFDVSVWEFFLPLLAGAGLVLARPGGHRDPDYLQSLIEAERITTMHFVPSMLAEFVPQVRDARCRSLRQVLCSGEALPHGVLQRATQVLPQVAWHNLYGPTEAAIDVTAWPCRVGAYGEVVPIGKPIANTRIYILDAQGAPVPVGVAGEIHIGGDGVARGYWNRPELTAERFVRDPFSTDPQARMYRTGDLGRWLPDGNIEYLGRNDFQVKLRGFRIELGEIEAKLSACAGVREAVVLAREDVPGDKRLVAYLTADAGAELAVTELRRQLSVQLPDYMVPGAFVVLDAFPLTPNGKLDRKALPAPDGSSLSVREYEAPQGETEQVLAEIWQSLLKVGQVGRHDHFFELGGHSLLAVQMVSHVRERLGMEVPLRELFVHPVLHAFAQAVGQAGASTLGRIERVDRDRPLPLSLSQQRLWFIDQLDPAASRAYHMPAALRLSGQLNRDALKAALDRVLVRQEGLRARIIAVDGVPHQVFASEDIGFALAEHDFSQLPIEAREQAVRAQAEAEAVVPFDFERGPLVRGRLLRMADEEHVLLITQHHIVSDGWSTGVMVREFAALYAAFCEGRVDPLPPLAIQYADYAAWQRGWLQDDELERQTAFWRDHLVGAPSLLELPTDRARPAVQSHVGGTLSFALPAELTDQLKQLGQRHGTTLFMVLLAGWSLLLSRLSGQDDVVIGTPVANRQRREVEGLIGFFVNTLALRVRVGETTSVADLLAQVKETALGAFAHQELPFEQVVEAVQPVRSLSHSPLFQVMLSLNNTQEDQSLTLPGLTLAPVAGDRGIAQFDLSLSLTDAGPALQGSLEYARDLFDRTTIERFAGQLITLLEGMVADEAVSPAALPLMTPAQRDQMLSDFNATSAGYPQASLIHELFERQAAEQPDALAIICGASALRYGELNARANRIAHYLIAQGVQADDRIALCVERSVDTVAGLLGILKAGGAYVPLDPENPPERLAFLLEDSAPKHMLTQSALRERLPASPVPQLVLDGSDAGLAAYPDHDPDPRGAGSRQLAYMIYTSGSTGTPKGVMVEHRSVVNLWTSLERVAFAGLAKTARVGLNASITFDASVQSLTQLLSGRTVVIFPQAVRQDSAALLAYLREHHVQAFDCTPAQLEMLLGAGFASGAETGVSTVLVGGEAISLSLWESLRQIDGITFHNVYGPTECTVDATACALGDVESPSIGKPLANTRIYILDAQGAPVPVGVAGEIHIGGDGVARGYWNRPELTAERFVRDPFHADPQARMYRTGDLGRWLPDGNIEYLGRNDFQVKLRGFRIELGEIEAKLAACAGVREAVVLAREDVPGDKRLVAYLTADAGAELAVTELRRQLSVQLPDYMVPGAFVVLDAFPLTPNGKLDRKALPAPDGSSLSVREYEAPQGETEQVLAEIWQSLLKVGQVGRHDHFFELGGHSLLAVQMVSHVRERLGMEVPLRELFIHPVLHAFAQAVGQAGASTLGRIERVDRDRPLPLSLSQQRLWFIDQLDPAASRAYHMPAALRLSGQLNRDALKAALDRVLVRQEGLRARIIAVDGVPHQVFAPEDTGFALQERDFTALAHDAREQAILAQAEEEAGAPFDLVQGPLIRGRLLRVAEEEHVLLITQHHIVSDGWSTGVIIREFAALYAAFCEGRDDPLPPLEIQYADYAVWQRGWLQGEELERQTAFWREHLVGAPSLLELPTDRPRPPVQSYVGSVVPLVLSVELSGKLRTLAQAHGTTLFTVLLAGWSLLLSRLSGQDDVVVGVPVANRQRREVEALVGFFVNTLALRTRFEEPLTVADLLTQVKETALAAFAHQELPFEQVVEAVQPVRSLSHSPLFQAMLSLNNTPGGDDALALPGLTLSQVESEHTIAHFDLSLSLSDAGSTIQGSLEYARDLFDPATIERFSGHFITLLEGMVADEAASPAALPLMTPVQRDQVLSDFNATSAGYPQAALIHELFERQAAMRPQSDAVACESQCLTYDELNTRANQVAHYLLSQGVKPDDRVAICAERSLEMVVGLLGILKAGGAYVPLDPDYPMERLAYMLEDSAPVALLTQATRQARLPAHDLPTLVLDTNDAQALLSAQPTHNPGLRASGLASRHLAYVIYTSGSTGTPKGVMVEHRNVVRLVINNPYFQAGDDDCLVHAANPAFDAATWEIWGALLNGARLLVLPPADVLDARRFDAQLLAHGATAMWMTVGLFNQYAPSMQASLAKLRYLLVGGDALDPRAIRSLLMQAQRPAHLVNGYGPTETTTFACTHLIESLAEDAASVPIGRPIGNTRVYILDARGEPVPVGVAGEIHIGGDGVARGYLNQPGLTAERFVRDPFSADPQARMYRTGDLGRWLPDGTIEFLGRNDFQVKIRGFRIELGEIEAKLSACAGVREAAVLAREDVPGDKRLVAYVVPTSDAEPNAVQLREALQSQLPEYMVPSAFVVLDAFPLTPNGKLDRKALPAPDGMFLARREYAAPEGEIEQGLAEIWQSLLKVGEVGRYDHFFELGGHSLLAVQMISHVRERLGVEVPLRELFARPVLESFALAVHEAGSSTLGRIERVGRDRPLPLSLAQQRLWFIDQLNAAASRAYHMPAALRLSGGLDRDALKRALDTLVARQEGLRARLVAVDGVPHQVFAPEDAGFALQELDFTALAPEAREEAIVAQATEEADTPFDLSQGPLIRGRLLRTADEEHVLLITQHHIVSDGWSMGVIIREFATLYTALCEGRADPLPPLEIQYADYAVWQRGWLQGEELERQTTFWREHLVGAPALLDLPTDRPRPPVQSHVGGTFPLVLPAELGPQLKQLGQRHGTTLFMVLLAGWSLLLSRLSGQDDVVVGTPVANRQRREVEALVGFFVNTLALRVRVGETASVAELLAQVKETTLGAFAHQELPFEQVVEAVQPARSMSHSPLFQVMLSLDNTPATDDVQSLPGLTLSSVAAEHLVANFDLSLSLKGDGANLHGELKYAADLFDRTTIERFVEQFVTLLQAMVADETVAPAALPLMTPAQRDQVLSGFNATSAGYPRDALIHALFEAKAAEQPEAIAVVCGDESIRYGELNARANRVAHHLIAQGVQVDDRVALCVERSVDTVVGLLGILKAGGAYVPLDPDYPPERLAFLLEDCAPKFLLLHSGLRERLPASGVPQLALDDSEALLSTCPERDPGRRAADSRQLIYMIYTSGSTGTPKGVMVEHRSVANLWSSLEREVFADLAKTARVGLNASITFDSSVKSLTQLLSGRTLVIFPQAVRQDGAALLAYLREHRVDAFDCTPAQLEMLLGAGLATGTVPGVSKVLIGGEAIAPALWQRLRRIDGIRFHNVYGPTECTVDATACAVHEVATPSIGKPLSNMQVYILDARGEPVPVGVAGEIHIGGDGVTRGYWNRPGLTAERFVRDPFSTDPQARMYRTGDLGRWLPDGNIEYIGRNDFQVKLRGFRIELGEIEAKLSACAGVREAVVLVREDEPGDKRLAAYVVPAAGAAPTAMQLREALQPQLPEYMVPSAFVVLDAFPLTPNGKLDRKALPAPDGTALALREYAAPQGETEQVLAEIWQSLLKVGQVGRHDHFFELGGHSLLAVQLVSHVRERLGVELALREIFMHSTLSALAARMNAHASTRTWSPLVPLKNIAGKPSLYLVPGVVMTASSFWDLAQSLEGRMNVHVLEARGLEEGQKPCVRMEDIVETNITAMRENGMPEGPIVLGGHSFGGSVAFEMARALEAAGHRVQLLLIDNLLVLPKSLNRMTDPELKGLLDTDKRLKKLFDAQRAIYKRYKPSGRFHGAVEVIYARDGKIQSLPETERMHACRTYCEQAPMVSWVSGDHRGMLGAAHADELSEAIWQAWRRYRADMPEVLAH